MAENIFDSGARWIWAAETWKSCNSFVCFRKGVDVRGDVNSARLRITADSRYEVYVNGEWLGHGPARSWPTPCPVDEYDLRGWLRPGRNALAVLVQHFGLSTFQYLHADPGLLAEVQWDDAGGSHRIATDRTWKCRLHDGFAWPVPRIACQQAWEEQFDARESPVDSKGLDWREANCADEAWSAATVVRRVGQAPHNRFELRDIPFLTREPVEPVRVLAVEPVRPASYTWSLLPRDLITTRNKSASRIRCRLLLATHIFSDRPQRIELHPPHAFYASPQVEWKLNGRPLAFTDRTLQHTDSGVAHARLDRGWNTLIHRVPEVTHLPHVVLSLWTERPVRFQAQPRAAQSADGPWLALGPFEFPPEAPQEPPWCESFHPDVIPPGATAERFETIWSRGILSNDDLEALYARSLLPDMIAHADVFAIAASERLAKQANVRVDHPSALLHDNADWTVVHPSPNGADTRFLLDFGREVVGYHEFEIEAPPGTVFDFHNFEFIQRDGRVNLAEGMNNSFRYVSRGGIQRYRTFVRRGFRYSYLTLRHVTASVKIRFVRALLSTYPVAQQGDFACSDPMLERIWHAGAHTVRCCAEDTYTDCPTYEQTHWVGDARNEAMVDLIANGDPRLSRHCWIQAARSLDRSPLVESHVPSGWPVILPAWSFLWMRWAHEHFLLTGDKPLAREMLTWLDRNIRGIESHLDPEGLFRIAAWNMFDWAAMDTPNDESAVTHQNCLAVLGLRQAAVLAGWVGRRALAAKWNRLADTLARAVNRHLWCDRKRAYYDCIHPDGRPSSVFSQQTQTAAYISGVATGKRARRCRAIIEKPPRGYVTSGSPFFMFFVLEGLVREGRDQALIDTIRSYWGRQIEAGATTIWEMMHPEAERMTRSHCHGWSAAPTYFLSVHVLGIQPLEPGFAGVRIAPRPGTLAWAHGKVPTPRGIVECRWKREHGLFFLDVSAPAGVPVRIELPVKGRVTVQKGRARRIRSPKGTSHFTGTGPRIVMTVGP